MSWCAAASHGARPSRAPIVFGAVAFVVLGLLVACKPVGPSGGPQGTGAPTWHKDIAPVFSHRCQSCHTEGGLAPFSLVTYDDVRTRIELVMASIESGSMPPWLARDTEDCAVSLPWKHDLRVTSDEMTALSSWVERGMPEGDAATATPLPGPPTHALQNPTRRLTPSTAWVASGTQDQFMCFVLDPGLDQTVWLTGLEVLPGNKEVVHHALVGVNADRSAVELGGDDGIYPCFGDFGVDADLVGVWAPGSVPTVMPEGAGIEVSAGSVFVVQIHYHPLGAPAEPDATALDVRWVHEQPPTRALLAILGAADHDPGGLQAGPNDDNGLEFRVPANVANHKETVRFDVEDSGPFLLWGIATHMHYIGTSMEIRVERANPVDGEPADECLIATPGWDFQWQRLYEYDAPIQELPVIRRGDTLVMECEYDNTMNNPFVVRALAERGLDAPVDVFGGDGTLNEMCIGVFAVLY